MKTSSKRHDAMMMVAVFGIIPCILGVGIGQYLRWSGTIWLTDAGGVWPIVCLGVSLATFLKLTTSSARDRTLHAFAWLVITWTWLYFPFWLTAVDVPPSSAVINKEGRVLIAGEAVRHPESRVWLLTGRFGNRIVHNVTGTVTVNAIEARYRFAEPYIATRGDAEDISRPLISAMNAALVVEGKKPRTARIALFEVGEAYDRLLDTICRSVVQGAGACPLKLSLSPLKGAATVVGGVWSKQYTEQEAIDERHLPTLVQLLTQDNSRLVSREAVFAKFMELAGTARELSQVARKPRLLNDYQFDELITRILAAPDGANEALGILADVNRLNQEQRQALRAKAFREASIALIIKHVAPLRISDSELAQLTERLRSAFETNPGVAASALEIFGERLPQETQNDAVRSLVKAQASYAVAGLRYLNFSSSLRAALLHKVVTEANLDDLDTSSLSREKVEDMLAPAELRPLIASVMRKCGSSKEWLNFAVRVLPIRAMTLGERKMLVNELMFSNTKAAFEFVSENRQFLEAADVSDVTRDYTKTIAPDMCLHLTHRNASRGIDYFSEAQLQIFRECAQAK